ncbi:MAG: hypothetical protein IJK93_09070 [Muribaculaceae bacterium]|nr:hypothetical protein [Muribaculaceae bacterium]
MAKKIIYFALVEARPILPEERPHRREIYSRKGKFQTICPQFQEKAVPLGANFQMITNDVKS